VQTDHVRERNGSHHLLHAPPRKSASKHRENRTSPRPLCKGSLSAPRRAASPSTIAAFVGVADRAPPGAAFNPWTILLARLLPLAADERDARRLLSGIARAMRDFGRRRGETIAMTWSLEHDRLRGLHAHGSIIAPASMAAEARKFFRAAVARRAGLQALPPRALSIHTPRGATGIGCARGWAMYSAKTLPEPGQTVHGVRGRRALGRPVQGRRISMPRFPAPQPAAVNVELWSRQVDIRDTAPAPTTSGTAAHHGDPPMPTSTKAKKKHLLKDFLCDEVSLCRVPRNKLSRVLIAKGEEGASEMPIATVDEDRRYIAGWASVISVDGEPVVDGENDVIDVDTLVEAAQAFMQHHRGGKRAHRGAADQIAYCESIVFTPEIQAALGISLPFVGWWIGGIVQDDDLWADVKAGEFRGFSVGGKAVRLLIEDEEEETVQKSSPGARLFDECLRYTPAPSREDIAKAFDKAHRKPSPSRLPTSPRAAIRKSDAVPPSVQHAERAILQGAAALREEEGPQRVAKSASADPAEAAILRLAGLA
jgi:hypothetical protein